MMKSEKIYQNLNKLINVCLKKLHENLLKMLTFWSSKNEKEGRQYKMELGGGTKFKGQEQTQECSLVINLVVSINVAWMNYEMSGNVCLLSLISDAADVLPLNHWIFWESDESHHQIINFLSAAALIWWPFKQRHLRSEHLSTFYIL